MKKDHAARNPGTRPQSAAGEEIHPVMATLSTYMSAAAGRKLPDSVIKETKHHILDTIAAMVSGAELKTGLHAIRFARAYGGEKIATVVGVGFFDRVRSRLRWRTAYSRMPTKPTITTAPAAPIPGCAIVPAALAIGEKNGIDGTRFIRAVALGYDVGLRAFKLVAKGGVLSETHNIVGTFGASAACGCAVALDTPQMRTLIDYASQQAGAGIGAWRRDTEHVEKSFMFGGMGARNGVTAAMFVQAGWTGVNDVFSGPGNLFQSYAPNVDPGILVHKLGEEYEVTEDDHQEMEHWRADPVAARSSLSDTRSVDLSRPDDVRRINIRVATSAAEQDRRQRDGEPVDAVFDRGHAHRQNAVVQSGARRAAHARSRRGPPESEDPSHCR